MGLNKTIVIVMIMIAVIFGGCIEKEPETVISVSVPEEKAIPTPIPEENTTIPCNNPQMDFKMDVERFLINDSTNNNIYTYPDYCCTHFSSDLVANMRDAGFCAHFLTLRTPGKMGHAMVFVYGPDSNLIIESITDQIFDCDSSEIDEHYCNVLGYYPEIITIKH